ncbi:hypothetical protein [Mycolicibacterium palauense]|uniref:hypothetical protein n=1 Tax=Mycolicibacterium palauense TaxID=2034511 RepID=UPI000BFF104D|nr:hypothetical protein [Mycolicibacterium palauense]
MTILQESPERVDGTDTVEQVRSATPVATPAGVTAVEPARRRVRLGALRRAVFGGPRRPRQRKKAAKVEHVGQVEHGVVPPLRPYFMEKATMQREMFRL